ncbi:Uncharacterised protein [Chromobacterium violaceum]|uniref:Uncharacterized protein n=1 Tax=Chromobacterium violaceum TaxID=536 RepID=A0A3S4IYJ9_CHRVL|nr:Uncharacterised protein [Chromobacterium violaceum]
MTLRAPFKLAAAALALLLPLQLLDLQFGRAAALETQVEQLRLREQQLLAVNQQQAQQLAIQDLDLKLLASAQRELAGETAVCCARAADANRPLVAPEPRRAGAGGTSRTTSKRNAGSGVLPAAPNRRESAQQAGWLAPQHAQEAAAHPFRVAKPHWRATLCIERSPLSSAERAASTRSCSTALAGGMPTSTWNRREKWRGLRQQNPANASTSHGASRLRRT